MGRKPWLPLKPLPPSKDRYIFTDVVDLPGVETEKLDITNIDAVRAMVKENDVKAIVNCAAYTNVDKAEDDQEFCALLNAKGGLIGINEAKYSDETVEGVGYAITISLAMEIIEDLKLRTTKIEVDESEQGYIGIQVQNIDSVTAKMYGMPEGVYVYKITENSAASESDLREKDIITKFDGEKVRTNADLTNLLTYYKAGTTVTITVQSLENGEYVEREVEVTLKKRPKEAEEPVQPRP